MKLKCSKCGRIKDCSKFNKSNNLERGHHGWCKNCMNKDRAERYAKNPDKYKKSSAKYRTEHPEYNAQYYNKNKDKERTRGKKYYNENKEKEKMRRIKYYEKNKTTLREKGKVYSMKWRENNPEKKKALSAKWSAQNKEKVKESNLKKYNLTLNDFYKLLEKQNGKCAICGHSEIKSLFFPVVDHCHKTNIVRGLLCKNCNIGLGFMKDDIELLEKAIIYLKKSKIRLVSNVQ